MSWNTLYKGLSSLNFLPLIAALLGPFAFVFSQPTNCRTAGAGRALPTEFVHSGRQGDEWCTSVANSALGVGDTDPALMGVVGFIVGLGIAAGISLIGASRHGAGH